MKKLLSMALVWHLPPGSESRSAENPQHGCLRWISIKSVLFIFSDEYSTRDIKGKMLLQLTNTEPTTGSIHG